MKALDRNETIGYFWHTNQALDDAKEKEERKRKDKRFGTIR